MKNKHKYPTSDSMISGSQGLIFNVTKASPGTVLIELYEPLKKGPESENYQEFLDRCIYEAKELLDKAMRDYVTSN